MVGLGLSSKIQICSSNHKKRCTPVNSCESIFFLSSIWTTSLPLITKNSRKDSIKSKPQFPQVNKEQNKRSSKSKLRASLMVTKPKGLLCTVDKLVKLVL